MTPDLSRVARAIHLDVKPLGEGRWIVTGGKGSHIVKDDACDCTDFAVRGASCKHLLRVALCLGDPDVISALRLMVPLPRPRRHARQLP